MPELSPWLLEQVTNGQAILFLGAGATKGAIAPNGRRPLTGAELRDELSRKFLGGQQKDKPLAQVAEFAKYEASVVDVQRFIRELFEPLQPADFHLLIPQFRWFAIASTNYDLILERAYERAPNPLQYLSVIVRDGDNFSEAIGDPERVPYLKLHGCISTFADEQLPLIVASEEYAKHKKNRERLFNHFEDWAREHPVLFCGYDLSDPNIQQIMFDLGDETIHRQTFAIVTPRLDEITTRYWSARRVQPLKLTFRDFMTQLDATIPKAKRQLACLVNQQASSIQSWVQSGTPTSGLLLYLDSDLQHVHRDIPAPDAKPDAFYSGAANNWGAIKRDLDVERRVTTDILLEAVLDAPDDPRPQLFLLKGHAGSGKSITLRRVAWKSAVELAQLVVWLEEGAYVRAELIAELARLTKKRVFLCVDDAIPHVRELQQLLQLANTEKFPVTVLMTARTNEWNVAGEALDSTVKKEYELRDLSNRETDQLLARLESHGCLGELQYLPSSERAQFFKLTAQRQLLVALHEATSGLPFEQIVLDEYNNIVPEEAKVLYKDVCTLHRFKVGVRAGLLSRVSGITFSYFSRKLLKPLEHVLFVYMDRRSRDYAYRTRHAIIADLVFRQILNDPEARANQLVRIVSCMNVDYSSDQIAFEQLIRGRELAELFSDRMYADRIFEAARRAKANPSHIEHQRAVFELRHPGGSARAALRAVHEAEELLGASTAALRHTKAMALRKMAKEADSLLERDKYWSDAKMILKRLIRKHETPYALHTYGQILLDELAERLADQGDENPDAGQLEQRIIADITASLDDLIHRGHQRFPDESYLLDLEARYARMVEDAPRAQQALVRANEANPENGFVAVRLAKYYKGIGEEDKAKRVLVRCIENNPANKAAHLEYALMLDSENSPANHKEVAAHLSSSFTEGDSNYVAQFWCARHEYLYGDKGRAKRLFGRLRRAKVPPSVRTQIRGIVKSNDHARCRYFGVVAKMTDAYCFIDSADAGGAIFAHYSAFTEQDWETVAVRTRVAFCLGFTFSGPAAKDVVMVG